MNYIHKAINPLQYWSSILKKYRLEKLEVDTEMI